MVLDVHKLFVESDTTFLACSQTNSKMSLSGKDRALKGKIEKDQQKLAPDSVNMAMDEPADRLANVAPRTRGVMDG